MYTQEPILRQYSDLQYDVYSRASSSSQHAAKGKGAELNICVRGSDRGRCKYVYCLHLFSYDGRDDRGEEQRTSLLPTVFLLRRRTTNIFASHIFSITMKNGEHLYFLQLFCFDEERQTFSLPPAVLLR